jgi:hypothetical protein
MRRDVAIGFRVKSGFAIAVVLAGPSTAPSAIARRIVLLSDPEIPETRQPYHDGFGTAQADEQAIARLTKIIKASAKRAVTGLLADPALDGRPCRAAGLVVGSTIDPARVGNLHIRAHASEGRLFRTVLEASLDDRGIACTVIVEKTLEARAAKTLGRRASHVKAAVAALGDALHGPWRAEEKAAATAAWMVL